MTGTKIKMLLQIVSMALVVGIFGCAGETQNEQLLIRKGSVSKLEISIEKHTKTGNKITPETALLAILDIYKSKDKYIETNEKPIDIYVMYGTDYWTENQKSKTFELTFAHQVVESPNGQLYEYRIDMIYDTQELSHLEQLDYRFPRDEDDIDVYREFIKELEGFRLASGLEPQSIRIVKEKI